MYYKQEKKYIQGFVDRNKNKYFIKNHILRFILYFILDKIIFNRKKIRIFFKISNRRDSIKIKINSSTKFYKPKPNDDSLQIKYEKIFDRDKEYEYRTVYKQVETSKIMYPFRSGGDGNRCIIKGIFESLGLLDKFDKNSYELFNEHEMFLSSSFVKSLMKKCENFKPCIDFYKKFSDNTYKQPSSQNWGDNIRLTEFNDIYKIENANHRVCCAKRFNIPTVYAEVYEYTEKKQNLNKSDNIFYSSDYNYNNEKILKSFYESFNKLGLNEKNAHYVLEKGLRGKKLIEYIEKIANKDLGK